jgi:hypothetical protein
MTIRELSLAQAGAPTTSIVLTPYQGEALRAIIAQSINCKFTSHIYKTGLLPPNVWPIFNGKKKVSLQTLERLISGTNLEVECRVEFLIRTRGEDAQDAPSVNLEPELFYEIGEESEVDLPTLLQPGIPILPPSVHAFCKKPGNSTPPAQPPLTEEERVSTSLENQQSGQNQDSSTQKKGHSSSSLEKLQGDRKIQQEFPFKEEPE